MDRMYAVRRSETYMVETRDNTAPQATLKESRVDLVRPVCCTSDQDVLDVHAVHCGEDLIENTVACSTGVAQGATARLYTQVQLVKEQHASAAACALSNEIREDMFGTDLLQVDGIGELHILRVNTENLETASEVEDTDVELAVKSTEPTENWVDRVRTELGRLVCKDSPRRVVLRRVSPERRVAEP